MSDMLNCMRRSALAALLILALAVPALASDLANDLGGAFVATPADTGESDQPVDEVDMLTADATIGYIGSGVPILNPVGCTEWNLVSLNQLVFEPVVDLDENMKPVPMLANNWEKRNQYWRFNLREGIQFHNGLDLTAYDVVQSWKALKAAGEDNPYYSRLERIKAMEATDILTLTVEAKDASYLTLYAMNFPVIQYATLQDEMPRGTGPYWYVQADTDGIVRLEANPLWWKQAPLLHSILLRPYAEPADAVEAIQTNQISMLSTKSPKAALCRKLADLTSRDYSTLTYEMLVPNAGDRSLLKDVRVRKAVMYAIDRSLLASNAYLDMAVSSEVPIPPVSWLYESQSAIYYYSPERALQLMNEVGWRDMNGDGRLNRVNGVRLMEPSLTIWTYNESTNSIRENAANMIADYLRAIGFNVTVSVRSKETVRRGIRERACDLALIGVNLSEVPDISAMFRTGGSMNFSRYTSTEMDTLFDRVAATGDATALKQLYTTIQMRVVEQLPILGLLFRTGTVLSSHSVSGLTCTRCYDAFDGFEFIQ